MQTRRSSVSKTHPQPTPLRRSQRLLNQNINNNPIKSQDFVQTPTPTPKPKSKKPKQPGGALTSVSGLRRSPRLNSGSLPNNKPQVETNKHKDKETREVENRETEVRVGLEAVAVQSTSRQLCERNEDGGVKRGIKRKRGAGGDANVQGQGWTKEQELALQRAYFAAKPTPNFWKKVSKLVPGKTAQDCFDKVHSDHLTPTQPQPRSRAKSKNLSPIEHLSFSASEVLEATAITPRSKRSSCGKQKKKSHHAQRKTARHLLQKHCHVYQGEEVDLFSILEPSTSPSIMHVLPPGGVLSTPKLSLEKQGFLQKCHERSSSGPKKHCSKLDNSSAVALVSPPVLKQIKNRVLHEKYIDQLHSREAKRKAEERKVLGKENRGSIQIQKIDEVRAAKNALVSDAKYFVNRLQHLHYADNSLDSDNSDDLGSSDSDEEIQF